MNTIPASLLEPGRVRRRYLKEFKAELVAQCRGLGVSMARVAMAQGITANPLRRWVVESTGQALKPFADLMPDVSTADLAPSSILACQDATAVRAAFVAVNVQAAPRTDLHIEIERGNIRVKLTWPTDAG